MDLENQPSQEPTPAPSVNDFINDMTAAPKLSADTVIDEATGEQTTTTAPSDFDRPKMSEAEALTKVKRFMQLRDFLQSKGLAMAAGRIEAAEQFKMEQWEIDWYCEVYASMVQDLGEIPKWVEIVLAEAFIMTPKIIKVFQLRAESKKIEEIRAKQYDTPQAAATADMPQREDFKKRWEVDKNGFFTHTNRGNYVPGAERKERPIINDQNYALLIKHNDQEYIDKIFK